MYLGSGILQVDDTGLNHLMVEIVTLTGPLSHTSEHRVTTMGLGHIVDQLHNKYSLAHSSTTKQAYRKQNPVENVSCIILNNMRKACKIICKRTPRGLPIFPPLA